MTRFLNSIVHANCLDAIPQLEPECVEYGCHLAPLRQSAILPGIQLRLPQVAQALYRVLKPGGVVVWVVADAVVDGGETGTSFRQALTFKETGFILYDTMIYEKNSCTFPARRNGSRIFSDLRVHVRLRKGSPKNGEPALR